MDAIEINQTFDLVEFVSNLVKLSKNGSYYIGPCPLCGGRDRFNIKRTGHGDLWICRKCHSDKYHSPIDLVMALNNENITETLRRLGRSDRLINRTARKGRLSTPTTELTIPHLVWQAATWLEVDTASDQLLASNDSPGWRYLSARGFHRGTALAWLLGYTVIHGRPAITIPWVDMDPMSGVVMALKYRFLQAERDTRFEMRKGSKPHLFGLQFALPSDHTLLLVEGEMNAMSIWQCLPLGVTCLSFGGETGGRLDLLDRLCQHYQNVFVWIDDIWDNPRQINRADKLRLLLRGKGQALRSVKHDGTKLDANELLRRGDLAGFLSGLLHVDCLGEIGQGQLETLSGDSGKA